MDRYVGRPFLKLLDCYVLSAMGQLDPQQDEILKGMEGKLAEIYGATGSWFEIVGSQMDFPDAVPAQIRAIWDSYLMKVHPLGGAVDPIEFAMTFVNTNFPYVLKR
ncbi:hypothetical protein ABB30_03745 [Stenotrophomonas ginsengisoli]|uniref:Uncharacterized protein n=2 Tax=Stenotrophomonas ginsengisoli TaxID=336566 RepID=A0A0R0DL64_9GAMM|nr:hypothetical protein ABB30_03745 [Stenotrophomonas ginsengisoli]